MHAQIGAGAAHACIDKYNFRLRKGILPPFLQQRSITGVLAGCGGALRNGASNHAYRYQDGTSAQENDSLIGFRYGIPMISYGNAVLPEIQEGAFAWKDIRRKNPSPAS